MFARLMWFLVVALIISAASAALAQVEQDLFDGQRALTAAQVRPAPTLDLTATFGNDWQKAAFKRTYREFDFAGLAKRSGDVKFYRFSVKQQATPTEGGAATIKFGILNQFTEKPGDTSNEWDVLVDWPASVNLKLGLLLPISGGALTFSPAWVGEDFIASADLSRTRRPVYNLSTPLLGKKIKVAASRDLDKEETTYTVALALAENKNDLIIQYANLAGDAGHAIVFGFTSHVNK